MLQVSLAHAPNPDIPGGYWDGPPEDGCSAKSVETLADASRAVRSYITRNNLGSGNWAGGEVYQGPELVARISYNGRIWGLDGTALAVPE
ncbi:hypothetical protein E4T66_18460 [Sinimarinibacterium sp. CAU 1509]|uniref:hypothetical protein n=1 Tax=Sinimarinibacterium sp. CAU 1509 TaxID=2562283 RepID=UPI0010AD54CF|nr:hypothetical protein [Sinimarinibacterium sp. CAU 1509]TJY57390.1 hypothetical protein E4T66_18460 [Sinimarinibacterium sp. CAU 1509]